MELHSAEWPLFAGAACQAGGVPAPCGEVPAIGGTPEKSDAGNAVQDIS